MSQREVVLIDAMRTPLGKPFGSLSRFASHDLAAAAIIALLKRTGTNGETLDHTIFGQAHPSTYPSNVGHYAPLLARVPEKVPGYTVHANSASGLQALRNAYYLVASENADVCLAGGVDSYSAAPFVMRNIRRHFSPADRAIADTIDEAECWTQPVPESRRENYEKNYGLSLSPEALEFALNARRRGRTPDPELQQRIVPMAYQDRKKGTVTVTQDEWITGDDRVELLAPYADGACAALLMDSRRAQALGLRPLLTLEGFCTAGTGPEQWQMSGVKALQKLLSRRGLSLSQLDCLEIQENSAADVLSMVRALDIGPDSPAVNPGGGALSLGKNDGADGVIMLLSLALSLQRRGGGRGAVCISSAGGLGMALLACRRP